MIPEESNGPVGEGKVVIPKTSVRLGAVAGANSSGFNVYRKQRRAENARLASLQEEKQQRDANEALRRKIEANRREAEDRTSKKAAKRRKRKAQKRAARERAKLARKGDVEISNVGACAADSAKDAEAAKVAKELADDLEVERKSSPLRSPQRARTRLPTMARLFRASLRRKS